MNIYKFTVAETVSLATEVWLFQAKTLQDAVELAEDKKVNYFDADEATDSTGWEIVRAESLGTLQNAMKGAKAV